MSAVIKQTKQLYKVALQIEVAFLVVVALLVLALFGQQTLFSFALGEIAGLLPHSLCVYWVFFRAQSAKNPNKMTAFYWGEGLKWASTIILIIAVFVCYKEMNFIAFFCGYFLVLIFNSLFPILLKLRSK
ncbi:F0F1 ATP synthase subunit I [Pasteurellaceae bacterium 15-036681]|nr:F0F1 ATP synthase subunit I [Pasteurellaceae bacterium 15-036681]